MTTATRSNSSGKSASSASSPDDGATAYARAVDAGTIPACHWVRQSCARHLRDLETGPDRGLWWDAEAVTDITAYYSGLGHVKGEWAGQTIQLRDWQMFALGSILGWKHADSHLRRYRVAYLEIPRKNSKSTTAAGLGNYLAFDDGEPGAEVYAAATKREQAKIVWSDARRMVLKSPTLRRTVTAHVGNLHDVRTGSKFEPLGADSNNLDGLHVHAAIIDEFHAHKSRALYDVLETAMGARRQPLLFVITTAGTNLASPCYEQGRAYAEKVLDGVLDDDTYFAMIYTIDAGDRWDDPIAWRKANPNYGISVKPDDLAMLAKRAASIPSAKSAFLTKRLNVWCQAEDPWIPIEHWRACEAPIDLASFDGESALLSLDLASKSDLAAMVLMFRRDLDDGGDGPRPHYYVTSRFYLPEDLVRGRAHDATAHYAGWHEQGWLTLTPGNTIDFRVIMADIRAFARQFTLVEIPHDPNQAAMLATELQDEGLPMVEVAQTARSLSGPMREAMTLAEQGRLHHDGNPILTWNVSNVRIKYVGGDDKRMIPTKPARGLKIDGAACLIMALARAMVLPQNPYDRRANSGEKVLTIL